MLNGWDALAIVGGVSAFFIFGGIATYTVTDRICTCVERAWESAEKIIEDLSSKPKSCQPGGKC